MRHASFVKSQKSSDWTIAHAVAVSYKLAVCFPEKPWSKRLIESLFLK
jgi:hypothetical protein